MFQKVSHRLQQFTCILCVTLGTLQFRSLKGSTYVCMTHITSKKLKLHLSQQHTHPQTSGALSINVQLVQNACKSIEQNKKKGSQAKLDHALSTRGNAFSVIEQKAKSFKLSA